MNYRLYSPFFLFVCSITAACAVNAAPVTTNFSGTIDWILTNTGATDTYVIGTSTLSLGDAYSFSMVHDSDPTMGSVSSDTYGADYDFSGSPYGGSLSINGNNFSSSTSALYVGNDIVIPSGFTVEQAWLNAGVPSDLTGQTVDAYWMGITSDDFTWNSSGEFNGLEVSVQFLDLSGSILSDNSIPGFVPSLNTIDFAIFDIEQWENGVSVFKAGGVLANNYLATPIPATVWLFGSGLIGLIRVARRKD